ncbi:MAG: O-antigen ligase family protein [Clostridia bacterium]|nr:O-antigen ligase family protein [Clostridia bacterium]
MQISEWKERIRSATDSVWAVRLLHAFEYVIAAVLLVQGNTVWMTIDPVRDHIGTVLLILLITAVLACMILSGAIFSGEKRKACIFGISAIFLYAMVLFFAHESNRSVFWHFILVFLLMAAYSLMRRSEGTTAVLLKYRNLICLVAIYSLVMWLLCSVLKIFPPSGVVMTSWNDTSFLDAPISSYIGIYFTPQGIRNTSIFTEAPMAALHYSLALLIEVFLVKKADLKKMGILLLVILTTMSTMGYLVAGFAVLMKLILWIGEKGWLRKKSVIATGAAILTVGVGAALFLLIRKIGTISGSIRSDDLRAGWQAFLDHPLLGNGFNNLPAIQQYMSSWRHFNMGYSSGLLWILSDGGLWLGAIHLCPVIRATVVGILRKQWGIVLFALSVMAIFLITVFQYSYLLSFLLAFLLFWQPEVDHHRGEIPQAQGKPTGLKAS